MARQSYDRYSLAVALLLFSVYAVNLAYRKAVQDTDFLARVQEYSGTGFQGLEGPAQFVLLLLMSGFFTITIVLRSRRATA